MKRNITAASLLGSCGIVGGIIWMAKNKRPFAQTAFIALGLGIVGMLIGSKIDENINS